MKIYLLFYLQPILLPVTQLKFLPSTRAKKQNEWHKGPLQNTYSILLSSFPCLHPGDDTCEVPDWTPCEQAEDLSQVDTEDGHSPDGGGGVESGEEIELPTRTVDRRTVIGSQQGVVRVRANPHPLTLSLVPTWLFGTPSTTGAQRVVDPQIWSLLYFCFISRNPVESSWQPEIVLCSTPWPSRRSPLLPMTRTIKDVHRPRRQFFKYLST